MTRFEFIYLTNQILQVNQYYLYPHDHQFLQDMILRCFVASLVLGHYIK